MIHLPSHPIQRSGCRLIASFRLPLLLMGVAVLLSACESAYRSTAPLQAEPVPYTALPGWKDAPMDDALAAFRRSCRHWLKKPDRIPLTVAGQPVAAAQWWDRCYRAADAPSARDFFTRHFTPYRLTQGGRQEGLLTGYYEPLLAGSLEPHPDYPQPVWSKPADISGSETLPTREEIELQGLQGKAEVLLWAKDPVDLFFLHIQGSGRVILPDGTRRNLGFAGKNGHPYRSIGAYLIAEQEIPREQMSMQSLKAWLRKHPHRRQEVLWHNPSYIFFQWLPEGDGPIGAQGVPLTPEASLAVDPAHIPYGTPLWLETTLPAWPPQNENNHIPPQPYQRLVIAQDTGSAIKGGLRGDLFFGGGERAEWLAGHMKQPTQFYLLLPGQDGT